MSDLAHIIAKGITAEAVIEVLADKVERDWQEAMAAANDLTDLETGALALAGAMALAPYRALLASVRAVWEADRAAQVAPAMPTPVSIAPDMVEVCDCSHHARLHAGYRDGCSRCTCVVFGQVGAPRDGAT